MYCTRKVQDDLIWVGANNRRLAMFEGVYSVPNGVSFNSYLLLDDKTVLFDTVDNSVSSQFFENLEYALGNRKLDYLVVHHMEPDHSATLRELLLRYSDVTIICNEKILAMIKNFFKFSDDFDLESQIMLVKEGDSFSSGAHNFSFIFAPMVHWPEVMVTYDSTSKTLFSADAFGTFGALNGALFADEVNFDRDFLDEARRYYTNIVGKYGAQVQALLNKASGVEIECICPLHGFVWRKDIEYFIDKYQKWSSYAPEKKGVCIAYASIYGHTENAAEILVTMLRERGVAVELFDTSVIPTSDIVSACFKYSHIVFASATYNAGIFITMEQLLADLIAHNIQNRVVGLIENGSWFPMSGKLMRAELEKCKNVTVLDESVSIRSSLTDANMAEISALTERLVGDL
ncbi:MAG: FprA family A-type flavoprotein [Clostridiales bacterium]|jgi:flavorubredoxin|nr:FprA family A-type flavoprotein [Clostridiales bacterium]